MDKKAFLSKLDEAITKKETPKKPEPVVEDDGGGGVTAAPGAAGTTSASDGGYLGPLGMVSKRKLYTRLSGDNILVKNPNDPLNEHLYSVEGKMVTENDLVEWFGADMKQKPFYNGGRLVKIEPKCLAFPYCNQGSVDHPIKLIGESKKEMCPNCYEYVSQIAEEVGKSPEYIAKIIREKYLPK